MEFTYEQALNRLRTVVEQLERGSLDLEKSLSLFEEGMSLSRLCDTKLQEVEARVRVLVDQSEREQLTAERGDLDLEMEILDEPDRL